MTEKHQPYGMRTPCANCPFRTDVRPYLTRARVREIERSLVRSEFPCHKTTEHDDEGEYTPTGDEIHCAGALILMQHEGISSQMTRIAYRLGMFDPDKLNMEAPVYTSFDDMAEAQESPPKRAKKRKRL
jgi:hypothetical protein